MAPSPQETIIQNENSRTPGASPSNESRSDSIVISGMSGLYPQAHSVQELSDILYNKVNPINEKSLRFEFSHPEIVQVTGTVPDLDKFDAQFFMVHYRLGKSMDPMGRKVLEQSYQAIYDAGVSPEQLNGKKIGVYVAVCTSESEKCSFYDACSINGFGMPGCSKTMFANRVSYWLNARGPSMAMDQACCSSAAALEEACNAISSGRCEAAIVAGANVCLHPQSYVHFGRFTELNKDGKTKSFDEKADGYSKSEAINVLFLQKRKDALRVYAEVLHAKTEFLSLLEDGTGPKFGYNRDVGITTKFLKTFYSEAHVDPQSVEYVEAFGCGTPEADKNELETIENVFCKDKDDPLYVGSVISNIGYTEAATGISSITKVCLGYHTGEMAANLHCTRPRQDVSALRDGRMRVVTDHQRFNRTYTAINGMAFTGVNSHVLLHGNYKPKDLNRYHSNIPHLVTVSGRNEEAVQYAIDQLKSRPIDPEQLALLHRIHHNSIAGHIGRGYTILDTNDVQKTISLSEKVDYCDNARRPLWFVYSGMGSQWVGMGAALMRIPVFAAAIKKCEAALKPMGIDIVQIITSNDNKVFDNILHCFVGIAAIQIGLTDVLRAVGLEPDGIIGHSVGELGCAYADGCLTAEEMILAAGSRGRVSLDTRLIAGSMAAVGLGFDQISKLCPPEIDVACHNGPDSCTISGPTEVMKKFVDELTRRGIFAKEVPCSNIAYHSRYIASAGPALLKYLKEVIKNPKPRTKRWLSTSVPESRWNEPIAQTCSAEYQTNNLLSPVLFEETSRHIPNNAVIIEVAPHGLLQAILKRSMPDTCKNISMTKRNHPDNAHLVLEAIGKLYLEGYNPKVDIIYPKIEFPVSTGTPFLSNLVKWVHDEKWDLSSYTMSDRRTAPICKYFVSLHDSESNYLRGNSVRGNIQYPFAASLMLVWDTFAMTLGVPKKRVSVVFSDLQLQSQPLLHDRRCVKLTVTLQRGTGSFEVLSENSKVLTGNITDLHQNNELTNERFNKKLIQRDLILNSEEIYTLLSDRDYSYSGEFRSIKRASPCFSSCEVSWSGNWVTFIDGMLQLNALRQSHTGVCVPSYISSICIDVDQQQTNKHINNINIVAEIDHQLDNIRCGGVTINKVKYNYLPKKTSIGLSYRDLFQIREVGKLLSQGVGSSSENFKLECDQFGDFDTLRWAEAPKPSDTGVQVTVQYAGISLEDVKRANGQLLHQKSTENSFAMEFSGITERGTRVMGLVPSGAASRQVNAIPELLWPVPEHWSLEDAATVPLAYSLAFYCLHLKAKFTSEDTIYVHGGCGALGQAVISIALSVGCEVFTAVSDFQKKHFLCRLFPNLKESNVGSSRDVNFADFVLSATKGKGCSIVISNAKENVKNNACRVCSAFGTVFDLVQVQDHPTYYYGMYYMTRGRNYAMVDSRSIFPEENNSNAKILQLLISEGISLGYVRPLSRVTYAADEAPRAFRLLAASQHRGRVLLRLADILPTVKPKTLYSVQRTSQRLSTADKSMQGVLIEQITKLADLRISEDTNKDMTLKELGISNNKLPIVALFLKSEYNIAYDEQQVLSLTINSLLELENELIEVPYKETTGWSTFFAHVDNDELLATTDIVWLPTLVNKTVGQDSQIEVNQTNLCIIPGMEGHFSMFSVLCERLKLPALVLQPGLDNVHESVHDTAHRMVQILTKKNGLNNGFYLLGYETGVYVALEMAAILEEKGLTGTVFCLGHSPEELKEVLCEVVRKHDTEADLQDSLLFHMSSLILSEENIELKSILQEASTWPQKLDLCVRSLLGYVSHSAQYARALIEVSLERVNQFRGFNSWTPNHTLRSQVVLLRAARAGECDARSLQQHTLQPLAVHQLSAPLAHAAADLRCSDIINSYLSPKILDEFENMNICDTYALTSNSVKLSGKSST